MARELTDPTLELLEKFTFAWLRGDLPDPREFLDRAPAGERADLCSLIDRFLVAQPARDPNEETLSYVRAIAADEEPEVRRTAIEKLRLARGLSIEAVVDRLRTALDLGTPLAGRLRDAYSDLERDWLDPRGVQTPVWKALASIFEVDVRRLVMADAEPVATVLMRRENFVDTESPTPTHAPRERDEIDELFRGAPTD